MIFYFFLNKQNLNTNEILSIFEKLIDFFYNIHLYTLSYFFIEILENKIENKNYVNDDIYFKKAYILLNATLNNKYIFLKHINNKKCYICDRNCNKEIINIDNNKKKLIIY